MADTTKTSVKSTVAKTVKTGVFRKITRSIWSIFKETWDELFQVYLIGHILGMSKEGGKTMADDKKGEKTEKSLGGGTRIFHAFSHEDEIKWNKLFSAAQTTCLHCEEKFMKFLHGAIDQGYDEDTLRIRLIGSFSEIKEADPAIQTIKAIVDIEEALQRENEEDSAWGKRVLERQIQFAKDRKLLVKKGFKNFLMKMNKNKIASLIWLIVIILAILRGCAWIFA